MVEANNVDISDYDRSGYDYTKFWLNRQYEDQSEKAILKRLLPESGEAILDIGGSFGRLVPLYINRFKRSVLLDYSQSALDQARLLAEQREWHDLETRQGNVYQLPFRNLEFDTTLMVRVLHHLERPSLALYEINRVLEPGGILILEVANKLHLKARLGSWLKGNFKLSKDTTPYKRRSEGIIYNFHPQYIETLLAKTGFEIEKKVSVSNLRNLLLKKILPLRLHLLLDATLRLPFSTFNLGPSLIYRCRKSAN